MPTDADFLRAIVADPDADAPRLAFADWREECGDAARAEFVRVQCALASFPEDERERHPLAEREEALRKAHYGAWLTPITDIVHGRSQRSRGWLRWFGRDNPQVHGWFHRGFVESLSLELSRYLEHAGPLSEITPVRALTVFRSDDEATGLIRRVADLPQTTRLKRLDVLGVPLTADDVRCLTDSSHLGNLKDLRLACRRGEVAEVLACSDVLGRLERLALEFHTPRHFDSVDLTPLFHTSAAAGLVSSSLCDATMTSRQLSAVLPFQNLPKLTQLDLRGNLLGDEEFASIPERLPPTLTALNLMVADIGDRAAAALSAWPRLRSLRTLDLSSNAITDVGAMMLADSPFLLASTRLDLRGNPISDRVQNAIRIRLGHHVVV